ncbi:S8 family peptidase [Desulfobacula sp.]|uniref:S8 family peptidase n=1 Tax=Desulfobacula sp. TaxID=2593537 RepID=UPI002605543D|nr:S8 family peptidase [Desulfobacula sp.]
MKKIRTINNLLPLLFVILLLMIYVDCVHADDSEGVRINIGYNQKMSQSKVDDLIDQYNGKMVLGIPSINMKTYIVSKKYLAIIKSILLKDNTIDFVEEDVRMSIPAPPLGASKMPTDPFYPVQWGPLCIGAEEAWNYGSLYDHPDIIVAVIDTGVDLDHPDLVNMVDTDIDYDFVNNDSTAMDDNGHGTHCAGIIAAQMDNGQGVAGLQNVTIMAVKGLDSGGSGWTSVLAQCITYAVDNGAKVLSNSWSGTIPSSTLKNAVNYAFSKGVVVVAAAGNSGNSIKNYPAAYPAVIGVAALGTCTTRAGYSNYGTENVFISAPGSSIYSTYLDDSYASLSGTSMACPHVAGVAAMWIGVYADYIALIPIQVMYLLAAHADDLGNLGKDIYFGWGRVDMFPWAD